MGIDYTKRPTKADPPPAAPAPPAPAPATPEPPSTPPLDFAKSAPAAAPPAAGPVSLTKRGQQVSLKKGGAGGPVRVNLNWQKAAPAPAGGGLFKKLQAAASGNIDLDLGCLFELADGRKGVVQALGNAFGALDQPPFIKLDKDDRSGTATDGENLFLSEQHSAQIKRIIVFAFIYQGAKSWSQAGGIVTIHSGGEPVTIALDETRDGVGMCAICVINGGPSGFTVQREVQYVAGHRELDELFGFGMNWVRGSK